jgi:tetratricopeptide (TPR) repeat protein
VFEGKVSAETLLANVQRFILSSGEAISAGPGEPPAIKVLIKPVDAVQWALYYPPLSEPGPGVGPDQQCDQPAPDESSRCLIVRAEQRLRVGRVDEAEADIDVSLKLIHDNSDAEALLSVISVVKNDKQRALALAQHATQLGPVNPRAWIALSYTQQASFKLEDALTSAERAAELEPRSSIALARVAELMLSLGKVRSAERAAQAAVDANADDSRAHTILGFVHLAAIDIKKAKADFEAAIARDSSDPLPRLGLGLAIIRKGNLTAGREQIEIAVALDPTNSLLRSYMGKAYYEEDTKARDRLASTQFGLAKQLDPKDPTPWFYDAILKQTQNRSVEALEEFQKSIELNDNRAVYRSKLLVDEDRATRETNLAQIYQDLGFNQPAQIEASKSVSFDPSNYSAHRFLSEASSPVERQEITRVSELLKAQLLQPLNLNPPQPQAAFAQLGILPSATQFAPGYNEFSPLFESNGLHLFATALAGNEETLGDEVVVSGLVDRLSLSLGQFHYQTQGFRPNNDLTNNIYDAFAQIALTPSINLQAEYRTRDAEAGDRSLTGDPTISDPGFRRNLQHDVARLGARVDLSERSTVLFSGIHAKREESLFFPDFFGMQLTSSGTTETDQGEAQWIYKGFGGSLVTGLGAYDGNAQQQDQFSPGPCPFPPCELTFGTRGQNAYLLWSFQPAPAMLLVLGGSYDHVNEANLDVEKLSPMAGFYVRPLSWLSFRMAAFQSVKPALVADQTIRPTQILGFSLYSDDFNGTVANGFAIAGDARLGSDALAGVEASRRSLSIPLDAVGSPFFLNSTESALGAYLAWTPRRDVAVSLRWLRENSTRPAADVADVGLPSQVTNDLFPLSVRFFTAGGFIAGATATYVKQYVASTSFPPTNQANSDFSLVDLFLGYRLPERRGLISLTVNNLFDKEFSFYDLNFLTTEPLNPRFTPARTFFGRIALYF